MRRLSKRKRKINDQRMDVYLAPASGRKEETMDTKSESLIFGSDGDSITNSFPDHPANYRINETHSLSACRSMTCATRKGNPSSE